MSEPASRLVCAGCGAAAAPDDPWPLRCPRAGEGAEHVLAKRLDPRAVGSPGFWREVFARDEPNPFVKFRELSHAYHVGRARGLTDDAWVAMVRELDARVEAAAGAGFRTTPLGAAGALAAAAGAAPDTLRIKDETGNVGGSHKARHLFGVLLWRAMARRTGWIGADDATVLGIASCGNAALAAAELAHAFGRRLEVFVPVHADPFVLEALARLGARLTPCARAADGRGDPCLQAFRAAVAEGRVLPFTCQGPENALVIEGAETIAWEIAAAWPRDHSLDRVFVQVGGGALASAVAAGFSLARRAEVIPRAPKFHAVQTRGAFPLARAWERFVDRFPRRDAAALPNALEYAAAHRHEFMWPWETVPASAATGILDDETYDWLAVLSGMAGTGGGPVVVDEPTVLRAHAMARAHTSIPADPTGTAGLAGWLDLHEARGLGPEERSVVLFTGVERTPARS